MFKQFALAVALSAVVITVGLSAKSPALSGQETHISFDDRWAPVVEAVGSIAKARRKSCDCQTLRQLMPPSAVLYSHPAGSVISDCVR